VIDRVVQMIFVGIVRIYRYFLSPFFGNQCRFHPTCSAYALEALQTHGGLRGGWFALKRLARCHPLNDGGVDLVPPSAQVKMHGHCNEGIG